MTRADGRRVGALAAAAALSASLASAQTVDEVVRHYLEARGGAAKLRAVHSLRLKGTIEAPGLDAPAPLTLELKRPDKMRTEILVAGHPLIRAYDGATAWMQPPVPGEPARPMADDEAREAKAQADVDMSPLVDAAAKGFTVELVGRDRIPGGETWRLVVRGNGEPERTLHLDTRSHLVVRTDERRLLDGKEVDFATEIGDYRPVSGLVYPHHLEVGPVGGTEQQRVLIQSIEVNPPLDDARFSPPKASAVLP